MAYERLHWVESETPLSADNMNNIEDGIEELQAQKVDKASGKALSDNNYTTAEKTKLAGIEAGAQVNPGAATTSANGLMSASDKTKLNGIAAGAEVNQNAFSNVKVGSTTVAADGKTDTLELVAGSNVTLTPDATNDKVTIAATDTKYNAATTSAAGLMSATDKSKLNGIEAGANKIKIAESEYTLPWVVLVRSGESTAVAIPLSSLSISGTPIGISEIIFMKGSDVVYLSLCGWNKSDNSFILRVSNATQSDINLNKVKIKVAYI